MRPLLLFVSREVSTMRSPVKNVAVHSYRPSTRYVDSSFTKSTTVYLGWRDRRNVVYWYCFKGDLDYILPGKYVNRNGIVKTSNRDSLYIENTPIADRILWPRRHFLARAAHRLFDPCGIWSTFVDQVYNYNNLLKASDPKTLKRLGIHDVPTTVDPLIKHLNLCKHLLKDVIIRQAEGLNDSDALKIDVEAFIYIAENLTWPVLMKTPPASTDFQFDMEFCQQDRKYQICC